MSLGLRRKDYWSRSSSTAITLATAPATLKSRRTERRDEMASKKSIEVYVHQMSKQTSRRGKRRNVGDLFSASSLSLKEKISEDYANVLFDKAYVDCDDLEIQIHAASHILRQFFGVQERVVEMRDYLPARLQDEGYPTPQVFLWNLVETFIHAQISPHYTELNYITPRQASRIMAWIESFLADLDRECPDLKPSTAWRLDSTRMWQLYLIKGVRREVRGLIQCSIRLWSDDDVREHAAGELVSGHPEEIAFIVDSQLAVAKMHLPEYSLEAVLVTCNDEIAAMAADLMLHVSTAWKTMATTRFCSIINDAVRLSEMMEARNEVYLMTPEHREAGENMVHDLVELSLHTINFLCESLLFNVQDSESSLSSIGSPAWEAEIRKGVIYRTTVSLRHCFKDLERWLSTRCFFPKVLSKCLELTMQIYVESFFSNTMAHGIKNADNVAENLGRDFVDFLIFFNGVIFERYEGTVASLSAPLIKERIQAILSLSRLTNPSIPPTELENDAKRILTQTARSTDQNSAAILHIAGLRQRNGREKSIEWLQMIANAEKNIADGGMREGIIKIKLPDLRNSQYIRKMRVSAKELHRSMSSQSLLSAQAMKRIIQPDQQFCNFLSSTRAKNVFNLQALATPSASGISCSLELRAVK